MDSPNRRSSPPPRHHIRPSVWAKLIGGDRGDGMDQDSRRHLLADDEEQALVAAAVDVLHSDGDGDDEESQTDERQGRRAYHDSRSVYDRQVLINYEQHRSKSRRPGMGVDTDGTVEAATASGPGARSNVHGTVTRRSDTATSTDVQLLFLPSLIRSSWHHRLLYRIDATGLTRKWEIFDALLNLCFCSVYVWNTLDTGSGLGYTQRIADLTIAIVLLVQYMPLLVLGAVPAWRSTFALLTVLATIPVFVAFVEAERDETVRLGYMSGGGWVYAYPFRFVRFHMALMACLVGKRW